jgi:glycosyltransferase involved in cell wall biosynthesis
MVLPSITETFGLVYPEAMSQGVPVIYSKGQGFDRQFQEGTVGYHVDPKNPTEIANKIIKITNNYDVISRNCSAMVVRFDWRKIEYSYLKIYKEIVFPPTMNDSKLILK